MKIYRRFRYRLYPTAEQIARIEAWEHSLRFLWNLANGQRVAMGQRCKVDRRSITAFDQMLELTELRADLPWLADVPRNVCAHVLVELDKAWQRYFKGSYNRPLFKSKGHSRIAITEPHPNAFRVCGDAVVFSKLGRVPAVIHRAILGRAKQCAIVRDGDQWFASIACEVEIEDPLLSTLPPVALDMGITRLVTDSNGGAVGNSRHADIMQPRMTRAQKTVERRKKGSKNREKAKLKVARLHRRIRRQREHALHVASHHYAKNHGTVIVEALNIQNMTRSASGTVEKPGKNVAQKRGLNRAISGAGWGRFREILKYKVIPEGGRVVEVPAHYSSQTCAECGVVDAASRRTQASFVCTACGHADNADVNAARVLLARGLAKLAVEATVTVCGGKPAKEAPVKQKLRAVRRGCRTAHASDSNRGLSV